MDPVIFFSFLVLLEVLGWGLVLTLGLGRLGRLLFLLGSSNSSGKHDINNHI